MPSPIGRRIEVRRKAFQTGCKTKLKQIGVACELAETLESLDFVHSQMMLQNAGAGEEIRLDPAELAELPIEPGEVWQVDARAMPTWVTGEGTPYRPWAVLVIRRNDDYILACLAEEERPPAETMWRAVAQAICQPGVGEPHRPAAIEVASDEQHKALTPYTEPAGVDCVVVGQLEHVDHAIDSMAEQLSRGEGPPSLLDTPGIQLPQIASFYAAAAEYYRRRPWQSVPGDTIIKVQCDKFESGTWYAVVMGQSGMQQGLAVYEDLDALQMMMGGDSSDAENAHGMSAMSLMFSEAFEMPLGDLDAAEKHRWPVAGPEAYPLVLRINPGCAIRPPLGWELQILEGCLRTIPIFFERRPTTCQRRRPWLPANWRSASPGSLDRERQSRLADERLLFVVRPSVAPNGRARFRPIERIPAHFGRLGKGSTYRSGGDVVHDAPPSCQ